MAHSGCAGWSSYRIHWWLLAKRHCLFNHRADAALLLEAEVLWYFDSHEAADVAEFQPVRAAGFAVVVAVVLHDVSPWFGRAGLP